MNKVLDTVNDLVECLEQFYNEDCNGMKRLPNDLYKYSGLIGVALSEATEIKNDLNNIILINSKSEE